MMEGVHTITLKIEGKTSLDVIVFSQELERYARQMAHKGIQVGEVKVLLPSNPAVKQSAKKAQGD